MKRCSLMGLLLLLVLYIFFDNIHPASAALTLPATVKVGLSTAETLCDFRMVSGNYLVYTNGQIVPVTLTNTPALWRVAFNTSDNSIHLLYAGADGVLSDLGSFQSVSFVPTPDTQANAAVFSYNNKPYRGMLYVSINRLTPKLNIINELTLNQYLYGVVPKEMSNQWPIEALKAQAVAARTYAVKNTGKHAADGYAICASTHCQAYGGYAVEGENARQAVEATTGQVLTDSAGALAYALYHSNSGGYTEDNMNVNGWDYDYLKGKPDPYSLNNGLGSWTYSAAVTPDGSGKTVQEKLKQKFPTMGTVARISVDKRVSGRVYQVDILDEGGNLWTMTGRDFGQMFNPGFSASTSNQSFMSVMFDPVSDARVMVLGADSQPVAWDGGLKTVQVVSSQGQTQFSAGDAYTVQSSAGTASYAKSPRNINFVGHGWGHGVGMSQWGAYGMAMQGFSYMDILHFYYEGANVVSP